MNCEERERESYVTVGQPLSGHLYSGHTFGTLQSQSVLRVKHYHSISGHLCIQDTQLTVLTHYSELLENTYIIAV